MGYETKRIIRLDFEDEAGEQTAYVRFESISFAKYSEVVEANSSAKAAEVFAESLVEWDLLAGGEPLPLTLESVNELEPTLRDMILAEWMKALRGVSAGHPLARKSSEPAPAPSMSMDDL
jgi:hypothetical protein